MQVCRNSSKFTLQLQILAFFYAHNLSSLPAFRNGSVQEFNEVSGPIRGVYARCPRKPGLGKSDPEKEAKLGAKLEDEWFDAAYDLQKIEAPSRELPIDGVGLR